MSIHQSTWKGLERNVPNLIQTQISDEWRKVLSSKNIDALKAEKCQTLGYWKSGCCYMLREVQICKENQSSSKNSFFQVYKEQEKKRLLIKYVSVISQGREHRFGP